MGALLLAAFTVAPAVASAAAECIPSHATAALAQMCLASTALTRAAAAPAGSVDRFREFETAATLYRRASDLGTTDIQVRALRALTQVYDTGRLDDPGLRDGVLRELIALVPGEPQFALALAALQEAQVFIEAAEDTLLTTRQVHPTNIEVSRRLAQFYARRKMRNAAGRAPSAAAPGAPLHAHPNGIDRRGTALPHRTGVAVYPDDAKAAGITGVVQTEIVIDETGRVVDAMVIRSVPMLDEAAVSEVREWRFPPAIFNGEPMPIHMMVTVQFAP